MKPFHRFLASAKSRLAGAFLLLAAVIFCTEYAGSQWTLGARFFGILLGAVTGFIAGCVCGILSRVFKKKAGGVTKIAVWTLLGMLAAYLLGAFFDAEYHAATQNAQIIPFLAASLLALTAILAALRTRLFTLRGGTLYVMLLAIYVGMTILAHPNIPCRPVNLPEGIYIYANDTVYNLTPLNLYSSRMKGFTHTGICLVTRTPGEVNARRNERGWRLLHFEKLDGGYYINDVNLDIRDRDGLANHASRTSLSDISFPFDLAGFNHYLAGRSANDRPCPAVMLARVDVPNAETAWQDVIRFRDAFNKKYPDGFIYSPVPYRAKYVTLYNCNTVIAAITGEILGQGDKYDFITDIPLSFGGQTAADGKRMLDDMMTHDRRADIARQYEFMKTAPAADQPLMHRLLHKNGWLHGVMGDLREE